MNVNNLLCILSKFLCIMCNNRKQTRNIMKLIKDERGAVLLHFIFC
jgi:hypothetical protein